jgi:hypothetical protein
MIKTKLPPLPNPVFYGRTLGEDMFTRVQVLAYAHEAIALATPKVEKHVRKTIAHETEEVAARIANSTTWKDGTEENRPR